MVISPENTAFSKGCKISKTSATKLHLGTSLCSNTPINHPHPPCCELISSLTAFRVHVCEWSVWALPVCQINASSEPCPGCTASLYQTSRTCAPNDKRYAEPTLSNEDGETTKQEYYYLQGLPLKRNHRKHNCISVCSYIQGDASNSVRAFVRLSISRRCSRAEFSTDTAYMV